MISLYKVIRNRNQFVEKNAIHPNTNSNDHDHKNTSIISANDYNNSHLDVVIIFQITTRSATKMHVVRRGIQSIIDSCKRTNFHNFEISVVTDDPDDVKTLKGMHCEVVVVDKNYKTNAIRKGRALQYAVEHRRGADKNTPKHWIFHMDDESYVTAQTVLALLSSIKNGKEVASEGPIFYPLKFEVANRITAIAESIRPFACYDCVSQMTNPPPLHMHGSNLLVRSDIEDTIQWQFGPTLAEDQMFGYKVYEKYGQGSMGWHGGILLEQPPLNIRDHFFQRRRWVLGTLQNLQNFPRRHRFKLMYKSTTYFLGFASAAASTAMMLYNYLPMILHYDFIGTELMSLPNKIPNIFTGSLLDAALKANALELSASSILLFTSLVWLGSYQLGLFLNLKYSKIGWKKRLMFHIQTLLLCPVIGLVETFPAFWATIEYYIRKKYSSQKAMLYDFYIVNK